MVKALENLSDNETVETFFTQVREDAFSFYYANPSSWKGLGFDRPPQPLGYADYDREPTS